MVKERRVEKRRGVSRLSLTNSLNTKSEFTNSRVCRLKFTHSHFRACACLYLAIGVQLQAMPAEVRLVVQRAHSVAQIQKS